MVLDALNNAANRFSSMFGWQPKGAQMSPFTMAVLAVALLIATAPLELSQIAFALIGAAAYALIQASSVATPQRQTHAGASSKTDSTGGKDVSGPRRGPAGARQGTPATGLAAGAALRRFGAAAPHYPVRRAPTPQVRTPSPEVHMPPPEAPVTTVVPAAKKQDYRQPSTQPVSAPTFTSTGWEAEVKELLDHISPTAEGDQVVQRLAETVKQTLSKMIPEVEVVGFASGDLVRGTAFGVAVPEVDVVVSVNPTVLAARLQSRLSQRSPMASQLDARKLQKSAIRACTDRLVSAGGFKFRRSAFRGQEPKVTLLAPASLGIYDEAIPIDFSVNSTTPLYNAALLTECGQIEPRAKALILLVKRWAKDRGVCHAAKGHLSPYTWSLLTIYFLQVSDIEEGPLLPPLEGFARSSGLAGKPGASAAAVQASSKTKWKSQAAEGVPRKTVADLFTEFVRFYKDFDWRSEAVCVRLGKRGPPDLALPLHIVLHEDGKTTEVGPSIEDPFEPKRNLGECTTALSLERLRDELTRAAELTSRFCAGEHGSPKPCTLSELLEPWVPPERGAQGEMDD
mmetsp:Transcript_55882/g.122706  ORF Transcript_55882/g.122706 Transcript_55882/m.122706 type:complete len:569 (-) Transcript_55882:99-1805(-)